MSGNRLSPNATYGALGGKGRGNMNGYGWIDLESMQLGGDWAYAYMESEIGRKTMQKCANCMIISSKGDFRVTYR